jgi:hypothetical protein
VVGRWFSIEIPAVVQWVRISTSIGIGKHSDLKVLETSIKALFVVKLHFIEVLFCQFANNTILWASDETFARNTCRTFAMKYVAYCIRSAIQNRIFFKGVSAWLALLGIYHHFWETQISTLVANVFFVPYIDLWRKTVTRFLFVNFKHWTGIKPTVNKK